MSRPPAHPPQGLPERIQAIAYSPDGRWLAVAGGDPGLLGSARLWRVAPGDLESPRELVEGQDGVFAVAFSPDSQLVAVGGADRAVRIWEVETGRPVTTIEDHADWVLGLAFSPDGKRIATASRDRTSKVFDVRTKESLVAFGGHARRSTRSPSAPRQLWPPAAATTRSGSGRPRTASRPGPSAASAGRCSGSPTRPTAGTSSPPRPTGPSGPSEETSAAWNSGATATGSLAGHLPRRPATRVGELGRRGPFLGSRGRQGVARLPGRPGPRRPAIAATNEKR